MGYFEENNFYKIEGRDDFYLKLIESDEKPSYKIYKYNLDHGIEITNPKEFYKDESFKSIKLEDRNLIDYITYNVLADSNLDKDSKARLLGEEEYREFHDVYLEYKLENILIKVFDDEDYRGPYSFETYIDRVDGEELTIAEIYGLADFFSSPYSKSLYIGDYHIRTIIADMITLDDRLDSWFRAFLFNWIHGPYLEESSNAISPDLEYSIDNLLINIFDDSEAPGQYTIMKFDDIDSIYIDITNPGEFLNDDAYDGLIIDGINIKEFLREKIGDEESLSDFDKARLLGREEELISYIFADRNRIDPADYEISYFAVRGDDINVYLHRSEGPCHITCIYDFDVDDEDSYDNIRLDVRNFREFFRNPAMDNIIIKDLNLKEYLRDRVLKDDSFSEASKRFILGIDE